MNYRKTISFAAAVAAFGACGGSVHAQSLFPVRQATQQTSGSSSFASLFSDVKAHAVGDILNITVLESTSASSTATTKTANDDTVSAFSGTGLVARLFKDLALTASNTSANNGTGATSRSGSLTTTLSVVVKEVLPNNTLRIEGSRMIGINKEMQRVTFVGLVRPEDITSDNTVPSNLIAGVEVHYDGRGIVAATQRRGVLSTIFHFLF